MKWLIASDIHGSAIYCAKLLAAYDRERAEKLILLGDILYQSAKIKALEKHGPQEVALLLNQLKDQILCVRGNCDTESDQDKLEFPILAPYVSIEYHNRTILATHGHKLAMDTLPTIHKGDILLCGHTHIPDCTELRGVHIMNPGSVGDPRRGSYHSYMTFENGNFLWKDVEGNIFLSYQI